MASETASIVQKERLSIGAKESPRVNTLGTTPIVQKTRLPDGSKGVSKGQYPRNCTNCARRKTLRWEQKSLQRSVPIGLHQLCKKQDSLVGAKKSLRVNTPKDRTNRAKTKAPRKGAKSLRRSRLPRPPSLLSINALVEVNKIGERDFLIKYICDQKRGGFVRFMEARYSLGLQTVETNVTTLNGMVLNSLKS
ncbi:hypothetical protein QYF36_024132 [Acer negundo]|nr:hypothetical protein QYF36_024132 [Acer negundo]